MPFFSHPRIDIHRSEWDKTYSAILFNDFIESIPNATPLELCQL